MKQAKIPLYIRFDKIPENESRVSVWRAMKVNDSYYPMLPKHSDDNTKADYFNNLLYSDSKVFLVTGTEIFIKGSNREPLLMNVKIIDDITSYYRGDCAKHKEEFINDLEKSGVVEREDLTDIKDLSLKYNLIGLYYFTDEDRDIAVKMAIDFMNKGAIVLFPDRFYFNPDEVTGKDEYKRLVDAFKAKLKNCDVFYAVDFERYGRTSREFIQYKKFCDLNNIEVKIIKTKEDAKEWI